MVSVCHPQRGRGELCGSTLVKETQRRRHIKLCSELNKWVKIGITLPGLVEAQGTGTADVHGERLIKFLQNIFLTLVSIVAGIYIIVAYTCGMVVQPAARHGRAFGGSGND